ncbi:uncharacterized protein LOC128550577 [Mercenaria mercenaria]|uniref:uncharacterized protein LOC128550577 n=1 Tax=Mercenaria mercenaria TaxID=6596 RepID=UPI00234EE9B7|nr:uncharacterized protein LOC128550577 [Mercenaria mercenaria]
MEVTKLKLGVEVHGLKLKDEESFTDEFIEEIKKIYHEERIVIFKDQGEISGQKQVQISKWFGDLDGTVFKDDPLFAHKKCPPPSVHRISKHPEEGCTNAGRSGWHIDGIYVEAPYSYA